MTEGYDLSLRQLAASSDPADRPDTFEVCGHTFALSDHVFSPDFFPSTAIFTKALFSISGASMLEIGCGTAVTAITAALRGWSRVVAVDINPHAVANARANVRRHSVEGRVDVRQGNLFSAIDATERFDLVYWNSNFVFVSDSYELKTIDEHAFFDPGYRAHRAYLTCGHRFLTERGSQLLGFSDLGDIERLTTIASECGRSLVPLHEEYSSEIPPVRYVLLRIVTPDEVSGRQG